MRVTDIRARAVLSAVTSGYGAVALGRFHFSAEQMRSNYQSVGQLESERCFPFDSRPILKIEEIVM